MQNLTVENLRRSRHEHDTEDENGLTTIGFTPLYETASQQYSGDRCYEESGEVEGVDIDYVIRYDSEGNNPRILTWEEIKSEDFETVVFENFSNN